MSGRGERMRRSELTIDCFGIHFQVIFAKSRPLLVVIVDRSSIKEKLYEVGPAKIEGVAELDQHVERHEEAKGFFAPLVIDDILDGDERAVFRQRVVGRLDQVLLFSRFQSCRIIPIVITSAFGNCLNNPGVFVSFNTAWYRIPTPNSERLPGLPEFSTRLILKEGPVVNSTNLASPNVNCPGVQPPGILDFVK